MPEIAELEQRAKELVASIREWCRSQKELWRQVPNLALEANGRQGFCRYYERAYESGYWAIQISRVDDNYTVYVDLATGELVDPYYQKELAKDVAILRCALNLQEFDAANLIKELRSKVDFPERRNLCRLNREWRARLRREYGIERFYRRKCK